MVRPEDAPKRSGSTAVWLDEDAGPVVRPYAMTRGRTRPTGDFDLIAIVIAARPLSSVHIRLEPERAAIKFQRALQVRDRQVHMSNPDPRMDGRSHDLLNQP